MGIFDFFSKRKRISEPETEITIGDILSGKKAGDSQKAGIMEMIPLFYQSDDLINYDVASPSQAMYLSGIPNYGQVILRNLDRECILIVPVHTGYITKHSAQDHAMAGGGLIQAQQEYRYRDAFCIEETQGGYIPPGQYDFIILPFSIRHRAIEQKGTRGYSRLWSDIRRFNQEVGIKKKVAHLSFFYKEFRDELGEFIAQFENLPNQIGAIILINNRVAGIEIAPNPGYWEQIWKPLIRSCYGAEAIRQMIRNPHVRGEEKISRDTFEGASDLDELEEKLHDFEEERRKSTRAIIESLMKVTLKCRRDYSVAHKKGDAEVNYELLTLTGDVFNGQAVREDEFTIYASITANYKKLVADSPFEH